MNVLSQPLPPLLPQEVYPLLQPGQLARHHLDILRWLVWLSLLSREELSRVVQRDDSTVWSHLNHLRKRGLVDSVVIAETGWPRRHHRYYLTDLGLYVLAASHSPMLSARKIAMSYPITRSDLQERLARPGVHLLLCDLITRLLAECPAGYRLSSYQQPYAQRYRDLTGNTHTILFDAAFLLQTPDSSQHAFYLHIDQPEHMFSQKEIKGFINKLFALRQWMRLQGETMPHLLLLTGLERFPFWSEHLERITLHLGVSLLHGSLAATAHLPQGVYAPIWIPFHRLPKHDGQIQAHDWTDLYAALDQPASARLIEQFSHYFSFNAMLKAPEAHAHTTKTLKRYVGIALQQEVTPLATLIAPRAISAAERVRRSAHADTAREILETLHGEKNARLVMSAQLTLALTNQQKEILAHLTRHPYLSQPDLLVLLYPESQNEHLLARQFMPLLHLGLVTVFPWYEAPSWRVRERYVPSESMLRYFAMRHGLSPAYYLYPLVKKNKERHHISPFSREVIWLQHGARLLKQQMAHTNGLYTCIRHMFAASYRGAPYQIHYWKSAQESVRWYQDPLQEDPISFIRPDAELLFSIDGMSMPRSLLIEYDRATTYSREHRRKMRCYADYQHATRTTLPPVLIIVRNERTAQSLQQAIVDEKAYDVQVILISESRIAREGLLPILSQASEL